VSPFTGTVDRSIDGPDTALVPRRTGFSGIVDQALADSTKSATPRSRTRSATPAFTPAVADVVTTVPREPEPIPKSRFARERLFKEGTGELARPVQELPGALLQNYVSGITELGPALSELGGLALRTMPYAARGEPSPEIRAILESIRQELPGGIEKFMEHPVRGTFEAAFQDPFAFQPLPFAAGNLAARGAARALPALEKTALGVERAATTGGKLGVAAMAGKAAGGLGEAGLVAGEIAARGTYDVVKESALKGLRRVPGMDQVLTDLELGAAVSKTKQQIRQREFFRPRNEMARQISAFGLTKDEATQVPMILMGLGAPPATMSPGLQGFYDWYKQLAQQSKQELVRTGRLTEEAARSRELQPLRIQKIGPQREMELQALRRDQFYEDKPPTAMARITQLNDEIEQALQAQGREAIYYPFYRDPAHASAFMPGAEVKTLKSSRLRQSFGKLFSMDSWIKDARVATLRWRAEQLKIQANLKLVDEMVKNPKFQARVIKRPSEVGANEMLFAPDDFTHAYRKELDFGGRVMAEADRLGSVDEGFRKALETAIGNGDFTWRTSAQAPSRIYAVPRAVGERLKAEFPLHNRYVRLLFDRPMDYWRTMVLAFRPAWISNNVIGNTIFSTLHGVAPDDYINASREQFRAKMPDEVTGGGLTAEAGQMIHLGSTVQSADPVARTLAHTYEYLENLPGAVQVGRMADRLKAFNSSIEDWFRAANFSKAIKPAARKNYLLRTGDSFYKNYDLLTELDRVTPGQIESAVKQMNFFMNDYQALGPVERTMFRRVVPFYSFLKHQLRLVLTLPQEYPGRAIMLKNLAVMGIEARGGSAPLPQYMAEKGMIDTATEVEVGGKTYRAFLSTTGSNPLILGGGPQQGEPFSLDPRDLIKGALQLSPAGSILTQAVTGKDIFGRSFTAPGVVGPTRATGRYFRYDDTFAPMVDSLGAPIEATAPRPSLPELAASQVPQAQLVARMIGGGRTGEFTAEPFSAAEHRKISPIKTQRTRWTELLRYLTSASIVLVDLDEAKNGNLEGQFLTPQEAGEIRYLIRQRALANEKGATR
jgi:hypothetical protein